MTTQKKKKSAKEKRVLIGSVVVAAAIVGGSTFAWFASKDEVTNRLTASANYNVSIVEDFQPPKEWIPGQTINKDVAAVNTGNVDAFVRMWLGGSMRIIKEETPAVDADADDATSGLTLVDDAAKIKLGLTWSKDGKYYKTLSTDKINNPNDLNHDVHETADPMGSTDNAPAGFSEVQSMQAAGVLVYAPANAKYTWELEQAADLIVAGDPTTLTNIAKGTKVGSIGSSAAAANQLAQTTDAANNTNYYGEIDASTFQPESTGLYLFRRNVGETADGTANTYEYSGYYFDKDKFDDNEPAYFALHTAQGANGHSDYVIPAGAVEDNSVAVSSLDQVLPVTLNDVKLFTATETLLQTDQMTWNYDNTAGKEKFTVTNGDTTNPISIDIALANIGTGSEQWKAMEDSGSNKKDQKTTFYYNNDVEAGDTTTKLVDSVTLSDQTKNGAYYALDFDLNVFMDSVQVTMNEAGVEGGETIKPWDVTNVNESDPHAIMPAKGTVTNEGSEIKSIAWAKP